MDLVPREKLRSFYVKSVGESPFRLGSSLSHRQRITIAPDASALFVADYPSVVEVSTNDGLVRRRVGRDGVLNEFVAIASDGALAAVTSEGVSWIDRASGETLCSVDQRGLHQSRIAASPSHPRRVAVGKYFGQWSLWIIDAESDGKVVAAEPPDVERFGLVQSLTFSADGTKLFVACVSGVLRYDAASGALESVMLDAKTSCAPNGVVLDMRRLDDRTLLVLVAGSRLFAAVTTTGELRSSAAIDREWVGRLAGPTRGGRMIALRNGAVLVIDSTSLSVERVIPGDFAISYELDGDLLADPQRERAWVLDRRGAIHRVELESGAVEPAAPCSYLSLLAWRGDELVVGRYEGPLELIDTKSGRSRFIALAAETTPVHYIASREAIVTTNRGNDIARVSLSSGEASFLEAAQPMRRWYCDDRVWSFDPKAQSLVSRDRSIALSPCKLVAAVAASPSGRRLFVALKSEALLVDIEASSATVVARYKFLGAEWAQFANEDEVVISGSKGTKWIDPSTGAVLARSPRAGSARVALSPNGQIAAVLSGIEWVSLFSRDRPEDVVGFTGAWHPQGAAFSADSKLLAVGGAESVVRIFDVEAALAERVERKPKRANK